MYKVVSNVALFIGIAIYLAVRNVFGHIFLTVSLVTACLYAMRIPIRDLIPNAIIGGIGFVVFWWLGDRTLSLFFLLFGLVPLVVNRIATHVGRHF